MTPRGLRRDNRIEYDSWSSMKSRCENPRHTSYAQYGGRGISTCIRWRNSFATFLRDMGPRRSREYSLERIDNNGNYEPDNCRWATRREQQANRRMSRLIAFDGRTLCVSAWAREFGINVFTLWARIKSMGEETAMKCSGERLPPGGRSHGMATSSTGYKGVYRVKGKFRAQLCNRDLRLHLGYYDDPKEAARAYNAKAVEMYGDFAKLNDV